MNLYLVSQEENNDYDTFGSMVVAARSEEDACRIHPCVGDEEWSRGYGWCSSPKKAKAQLIGSALKGQKRGVILASFNAG